VPEVFPDRRQNQRNAVDNVGVSLSLHGELLPAELRIQIVLLVEVPMPAGLGNERTGRIKKGSTKKRSASASPE